MPPFLEGKGCRPPALPVGLKDGTDHLHRTRALFKAADRFAVLVHRGDEIPHCHHVLMDLLDELGTILLPADSHGRDR